VSDPFPDIRDLAVIGDRRTAALLGKDGSILWYCPERFDHPSMFAALLDAKRGGAWTLHAPGLVLSERRYLEDSGVLATRFTNPRGDWTVTDWMPLGEGLPTGICRSFSAAPAEIRVSLHAAPDYARREPRPRYADKAVVIDGRHSFYASHPLEIRGDTVHFSLPAGEEGWAFLSDTPVELLGKEAIARWLEATLESWRRLSAHAIYRGPYEREVADSLRALRLLTFEENGGIIAAPTTSLPEVIGGARNYDYRYVWLRDAGMIVSALTRAGSDGIEEQRFLDFICSAERDIEGLPLLPFYTLDGTPAPDDESLDLAGYRGSRPVRTGNEAKIQLQLDALGNVLLAAKLIYNRFRTRAHWNIVEEVADYLAENWREPDYGLWEELEQRQYTSSKVIVACGLDAIADHSESDEQARYWRSAVRDIREFIAQNCLNSEGAYAAVAGGEAVDVSAALFPVWGYTDPNTPEILATMHALERDYREGHLYRRHLESFDSKEEGAFLAGTFWVAQYWVMRGDLVRAREILDAGLGYANDLGLFAEEADPATGLMLGNFPQTFVHAAFIGAVIDLKTALQRGVRDETQNG
jgi:GH15 family glucan-1,4-alpha-glucosidase